MATLEHIQALRQKINQLEDMIFEEDKRPSPDYQFLHELKARKLKLKEEILRLKSL